MRTIELSKHLRQHLLEVEVVVYVREELRVCLSVSFPVDAMDFRVIEFFFNLLPYVAEYVFALFCRLVFKLSAERNALLLAS